MNLTKSDVRQTIAYINNSFQDFAKRCPSESFFKKIQQTSFDQLQGLVFLFVHDPKIIELITSTQDVIKKTEFKPDGVGRSSAQPSGDVGQGGIYADSLDDLCPACGVSAGCICGQGGTLGDGGIMDGSNRTTTGAIGQP